MQEEQNRKKGKGATEIEKNNKNTQPIHYSMVIIDLNLLEIDSG